MCQIATGIVLFPPLILYKITDFTCDIFPLSVAVRTVLLNVPKKSFRFSKAYLMHLCVIFYTMYRFKFMYCDLCEGVEGAPVWTSWAASPAPALLRGQSLCVRQVCGGGGACF